MGAPHDPGDAPVSEHERTMWDTGRHVIGIDEVGRGAWAGPVTVAAVILSPDDLPRGARDSKRLSPTRRASVAERICATALVGVGSATNEEVDDRGLTVALQVAARRAYAAVMALPDAPTRPLVLVDGPHDLLHLDDVDVVTMVRGDASAISIASASVVAKVHRDALMGAADTEFPAYGFARNRGYGSPEHADALTRIGPCALHRRSWAPIRQLRQPPLL